MPRALVSVAVPLLALASCRAPGEGPLAPEGVDSILEYLTLKYDRDGDGAVSPAEYTRPGQAFTRLDANADGKLTGDDFPEERSSRNLGIRDLPEDERQRLGARYAARAVVLAYLRPGDGPGDPELSLDALERGFARLDRDGSGAIDAAEFARATDTLPWGGPGDAWTVLLAAVDGLPIMASTADSPAEPPGDDATPAPPPDGRVALDELRTYHEALSGPEGVLRGPPGVDPRAVAPGLAGDGPPVGMLAPDFEISALQSGARVRLSQWRGKKPVALVFGSYT